MRIPWVKIGAVAAAGVAGAIAIRNKAMASALKGRSVLVTGGSHGLGQILALEFSRRGAFVTICAPDADELDRAQQALAREGCAVGAIRCDVTTASDVQKMVDAVIAGQGRIDILVNNAGIIKVGPVQDVTRQDYRDAMDVHFWGAMNTIDAVLPSMRKRKDGRIVNISSIAGKMPVPHLLPYTASKFALVGYQEGLRTQLAKDGISVITVCPGLMRTDSTERAEFRGRQDEEHAWFALADRLPGLSMDATRAAEQIVDACVRNKSELVLTLPASIAARAYGLFPSLVLTAESVVNRLLPQPSPGHAIKG